MQQHKTESFAELLGEDRFNPMVFLELINMRTSVPLTFSAWQLEVLDYLADSLKKGGEDKNIFIAISGGRGCGKTTLASFLSLWIIAVGGNNNTIARVTANNENQAKNVLWRKIEELYNNLKLDFCLERKGMISIVSREKPSNDIAIKIWSLANESTVRGEHADLALRIFDEALGIPDKVYSNVISGLTSGINITILLGNPFATKGFFFSIFQGENYYNFFTKTVSVFDCDHIDTDSETFKSHIQALKTADVSEDLYRVEILGQFPKTNLSCFFHELPKVVEMESFPGYEGVIGIDIATGEGNDRTVIAQRLDGIIYIHFVGRCSLPELSEKISRIYYSTRMIAIDAVCIGTAIKQQLAARNIFVRPILGNSPSSDYKALNYRAELYLKLRDFFLTGGSVVVPFHQKDIAERQIRSIKSEFTEKGQIKMFDKKKDVSESPDIVDAMTYTFSFFYSRRIQPWR